MNTKERSIKRSIEIWKIERKIERKIANKEEVEKHGKAWWRKHA